MMWLLSAFYFHRGMSDNTISIAQEIQQDREKGSAWCGARHNLYS